MKKHIDTLVILLLLVAWIDHAAAQELRSVINLKGSWKFEIGNEQRWAEAGFNDSRWETVDVPAAWEEQGYPGYDGYAWYRKHFRIDESLRGKMLYLQLGYIDDVSETYLNDRMIGFGGIFPPDYVTSARNAQTYYLRPEDINYGGDNVLAVQVYDDFQAGGIVRGDIGIYALQDPNIPDLDLSGEWKFSTGDNQAWRKESFDDAKWSSLMVPGYWETQGYRLYDGFAWYRRSFTLPPSLAEKRLILLLGRIDDGDEVYLNGQLIGRTGLVDHEATQDDFSTEWLQQRAYSIPSSLLHSDKENVLAVRVIDVWMHGGIYDGPVGIVQREKYRALKETKSISLFARIFKALFGN